MTYECFKYTGHIEAKEINHWIDVDTRNHNQSNQAQLSTRILVQIMIIEKYG